MRVNKLLIMLVISIILAGLAACDSANDNESSGNKDADEKTIDMGQINWAENIAVTNMWKVILAEHGYDVEFHVLDIGTTMEALANDELDIGMEIWLPIQDASYLENYQDKIGRAHV